MKINKKLILASGSPRRKQIMAEAGFAFDVEVKETDESFDSDLPPESVPEILAKRKVEAFNEYNEECIVIGADTVVIVDNTILNKPRDREDAVKMLSELSGKSHNVVTGVCIKIGNKYLSFSDTTTVYFKELSNTEIEFYIQFYAPYDKAGAYGVQDFIGMIGIEKINGSFYTVMGLPIHKIYQHLKHYIEF